MAESTHAFICKVCEERMNIRITGEIDFNAPISQSYKLDSINIFELAVSFEEEYGVGIPDEDIVKISKINLYQLSEYLESLKKA